MAISLDNEQRKAVNCKSSSIIIAGPGSGKTRVLTEKAKLVKNGIALTFTRAAAEEIKNRAPHIEASTIHALCYKHLGYFPGNYDLLLEHFLARKFKPKYHWVLVDEVQDITNTELAVILSITGQNIFAVGDSEQSIFGFAEALGKKVFSYFRSRGLKSYYLVNNYRSNEAIVNKLENISFRGLQSRGKGRIKGTAILFRTNKQLDLTRDALEKLGIKCSVYIRGNGFPGDISVEGKGNIELLTIHCAKGKEWKKVICFDWGERHLEKNLYYVAVSRASEEFHLVNSISELEKCLKL